MVGGFISLVTFLLTNYGAFEGLSREYFPDEEKTYLGEQMELIHVMLFLVFSVFIVQILVLLFVVWYVERQWKRNEKEIVENGSKKQQVLRSEYGLIREEFVNPTHSKEGTKLHHHFDFQKYLSMCLADTIAATTEIKVGLFFCLCRCHPVAAHSMAHGVCAVLSAVLGSHGRTL